MLTGIYGPAFSRTGMSLRLLNFERVDCCPGQTLSQVISDQVSTELLKPNGGMGIYNNTASCHSAKQVDIGDIARWYKCQTSEDKLKV